MTKEEILDLVVEEVSALLEGSPGIEVTGATDPIQDLGLDSLHGVEIMLVLEEKLPFDLPLELNAFVEYAPGGRKRSRTIGEFVEELLRLQDQQEAR